MAEKRSKLEFGAETTTTAQPDAGLRYIGDGEYIPGVPARDLTVEEAALYATRIGASEAATGRILYQEIGKGEG